MEVQETQRLIGELNCHVVDALGDQPATLLAVFCHGFGAPGNDLVSLASEVIRFRPALADKVRFVFPEAPLDLSSMGMWGSRAWWMIDMEALNRCMQTGEFRDLEYTQPEGLVDARNNLSNTIDILLEENQLSRKQLVLGGFSQGSMLSMETLLNSPDSLAGVCLFSTAFINRNEWEDKIPLLKDTPIIQSHGVQDPILPYDLAEKLKNLLVENGYDVNFIPFQGAHQIPWNAIEAYVELIEKALS